MAPKSDNKEHQYAELIDQAYDLSSDIQDTLELGLSLEGGEDPKVRLFSARVSRLDSTFVKFTEIISQVKLLAFELKEDIVPLDTLRKETRAKYYEALSINIPSIPDGLDSSNHSQHIPELRPTFKLPTIDLPTFDGDLTKWPVFKDTFLALIHHNDDLRPIQKYHYLRSGLKGSALQAIAIIPFSELEYSQAWNTLLLKYDNKRLQAINHLTKIFNFQPISKVSLQSLQNLTEVVFESVTAFRNLKFEDESGFILMTFILRLLNPYLRDKFETLYAADGVPTLKNLMDFVHQQNLLLQSELCASTSSTPPSKSLDVRRVLCTQKDATSAPTDAKQPGISSCLICRQEHLLYQCPDFLKKNAVDRFRLLKFKKVCFNCLSSQHLTKKCRSRESCHQCGKRHHTLLHLSGSGNPDDPREDQESLPLSKTESQNSEPLMEGKRTVLATAAQEAQNVLLGTVQIRIKDSRGRLHPARMVIDCGAQRSFITRDLAEHLKLPLSKNPHRMCGLDDTPIDGIKYQATCQLFPSFSEVPMLATEAVVVSKISHNMPSQVVPGHIRESFRHLQLADPEYWKPGPINFLLGADLFPQILKGRSDASKPSTLPSAIETIFGWVIMGPVKYNSASVKEIALMTTMSSKENLNALVHKFWEIEEVTSTSMEDPLDTQCEAHFEETHARDQEGRYIVRLPFRVPPPDLKDSRTIAIHRYYGLERKFDKDQVLKKEYTRLMKEQVDAGYLSVATRPGLYFLPHHGVSKESSTTSLRIVYDASSSTRVGSLNDVLLSGPKLQRDIRVVLLNYRLHRYAMVADICKMFLQILVHPDDRPYQHLFFRFDAQDALEEYEFKRLTFGLTCSPYLAIRVLQQLIKDEGSTYPRAAKVLKSDIYIDDILTGAETLEEAMSLKEDLISLLKKGGFILKRWNSNDPRLLQGTDEDLSGKVSLSDFEDSTIKILGLEWDVKVDCLSYRIQPRPLIPTKRGVMSTIARMYDPLGYLAPVVFRAKVILQSLWRNKLDWDCKLPSVVLKLWEKYYEELTSLRAIKIPRCLFSALAKIDLIGFADASEDGYAAVVYIRIEKEEETSTQLIMAKTKLAPLKTQTIPRLELCAALLLTRTVIFLSDFLSRLDVRHIYLISDSMTVLSWLVLPTHRLKTFVANRVSVIQDLQLKHSWSHVSSADNAADIASRGTSPKSLATLQTWWHGPHWLTQPVENWPTISVGPRIQEETLPDLKQETVLLAAGSPISLRKLDFMERISTLPKLIRVLAYIRRFIINCRVHQTEKRKKGYLQLTELREALEKLIIVEQQASFGGQLNRAAVKSLSIFTDTRGVLRVGGRLQYAPIKEEMKHPILLPRCGHFVELLIDNAHVENLHAGPQLLHSLLRQRYWILSARRIIRSRVHKCLRCHRMRTQGFAPFMSDLPPSRFHQGRPFINVGTDFAGPFAIRDSLKRKAAVNKAYICIFVCLSTKAVHIETVSQLTTAAFIACFDRFIARRGLPSMILSDNGTNFVGAQRTLKEIQIWWNKEDTKQGIRSHLSSKDILWQFIPPHSPHFGGIWEAGVKSFKGHLTRVVGNDSLTFEELSTLSSRIEALLNSRPLYPLSSEPDSFDVLTPGHFLIGAPLVSRLDYNLEDVQTNRLTRWKVLEKHIQLIWRKWHLEYLHHLQQRSKWMSQEEIQAGTLVLLKDKNSPPLQWTMGRIDEIYPGKDGVTRVVKVKTPNGSYVRSLTQLLAPLLPPTD